MKGDSCTSSGVPAPTTLPSTVNRRCAALAKAFDEFCAVKGYEEALPVIDKWLSDPHPNVRRAVTEGLRIWTSRPYFRDHPGDAVSRLSRLRGDSSEYVPQIRGKCVAGHQQETSGPGCSRTGNLESGD